MCSGHGGKENKCEVVTSNYVRRSITPEIENQGENILHGDRARSCSLFKLVGESTEPSNHGETNKSREHLAS